MSNMIYGFCETNENGYENIICNECLKNLGIKRYKNIDSYLYYGERCYYDETLGLNYISDDNKKKVDKAFEIASKIKKKLFKENYELPTYEIIKDDDDSYFIEDDLKEYHLGPHIRIINITFIQQ